MSILEVALGPWLIEGRTNPAGYFVGPNDKIALLVELMNQAMESQTAVLTITYEYIPSRPSTFNKITPVWLDIGTCHNPDLPAKKNTTFQYTSSAWSANVAGWITCGIGHLHDGGTHLKVSGNNNTICDAKASYGQSPGFVDPAGSMDMMNMGAGMVSPMSNMGKHISSISPCDHSQVNLGDTMSVAAYYNTSEYQAMANTDGGLEGIMGIALLYVAVNETATTTAGASTTSSVPTFSSTNGAASVTVRPASVAGVLSGILALGFVCQTWW